MREPLSVRMGMISPLIISVLILVSGFVAIAWVVKWSNNGQQIVAPGSGLSLPIQSNVSSSLPAFTLSSQPAGQIDPAAPAGTVTTPDWLAVKRGDQLGEYKVFAGWWYNCHDITVGGVWVGPETGEGIWGWNQLNDEQRQAVANRCMQDNPLQPAPTAPPLRYQWLDRITDQTGGRWVWIGEWFVSCGHIMPDYTYQNERDAEAVAAWNRLPFDDQDLVKGKCRE